LLTFGCNDDGDTNVTEIMSGNQTGELDEPAGDDGSYVISMKGGEGTGAYGGDGGDVYLDCYANVGMYVKTRDLDTSFTVPTPVYPESLGDNGVSISEDTVVAVVTEEPAEGELYMVLDSTTEEDYYYLFVSDGDGVLAEAEERATGLKVDAGATLTLGLNYDWNTNGSMDAAYVWLTDDLVINGTLATADLSETGELRHDLAALAGDKGSLVLNISGRMTMAEGSVLDISGDAAAAESGARGGDGGRLSIDADNGIYLAGMIDASGGNGDGIGIGGWAGVYNNNSSYGIEIDCNYGTLINTGGVDTSGGNGSTGGNAADVDFYADSQIYNSGDLYATGGTGSTGAGGIGDDIYMDASLSLFNSGDMVAHGGDGATAGGDAGSITCYGGDNYAGDLISSGALYADGGDCSGELGNGGDGGDIYLETGGGDLVSTGEIHAIGGVGVGDSSYGGYGGDLEFYMDYGYDGGYGDEVAAGAIQVTGDICLDGGSGYYGGNGGYFDVTSYNYDYTVFPPVQPSELLGYAQIDVSGGDGATDGGDAGDVDAYTEDAWYGDDYTAYPVGAIANRVAILAKGGTGVTGYGGDGGYLDWEAEGEAYFGTTEVLNSGDIDVSGGSGFNGGDSGGVYFYGHDYAENTGTITALGGEATGDAGDGESVYAGYGADEYIELYSAGDVLNTGDVIATGGEATGTATGTGTVSGGYCYDFYMWAVDTATVSGSLYFNGGDSTDIAGDGGDVEIVSMKTASAITSELITVAAGSGATAGDVGSLWIDGFDVTPVDGIFE